MSSEYSRIIEILHITEMFKSEQGLLPEYALRPIASDRATEIVTKRKGETVYTEGETTPCFLIILDGIAHLRKTRTDKSRTQRHVAFRAANEQIGLTTAIAKRKHPYSAIAITDCEFLQVDRDSLLTTMCLSREITENVVTSIAKRFQFYLDDVHAERRAEDAEACFAQFLVNFWEASQQKGSNTNSGAKELPGAGVSLYMEQRQIAELIGVPFETLRKEVIPRLRIEDGDNEEIRYESGGIEDGNEAARRKQGHKNAIRTSRGRIEIVDVAALESCYKEVVPLPAE